MTKEEEIYDKMDVLTDALIHFGEVLMAILESLSPEQKMRIAKKIGTRFS